MVRNSPARLITGGESPSARPLADLTEGTRATANHPAATSDRDDLVRADVTTRRSAMRRPGGSRLCIAGSREHRTITEAFRFQSRCLYRTESDGVAASLMHGPVRQT